MSRSRSMWVGFYALVALAALVATWSQNLAYFGGPDSAEALARFALDTRVNAASRSITVDIGLFFLAAAPFMLREGRRVGVRFVWLYFVFGMLVAISVTFPLFMLARELRLEAREKSGDTTEGVVSTGDYVALGVFASVVVALTVFVLRG